ncbi:MAG TPA: isochorismatase family protein [Thermoanaerobaculia bacterium]|nr:isochorismatase family protein [Thermoanaerobaculia bacterium]
MAEYDSQTALIVVDMQNDFADPRGALYVRGGEEVLPVANAEIAKARAAGALVVYTQDWHPPSTPHFAKDGGTWPVHCVRGTWGAALHPDLDVPAEADESGVTLRKVVRTGTGDEDGYTAFEASAVPGEPSRLETLLREQGVELLVVLGLATDYCVRATTLDGLTLGFAATVLAEGVRPVDLQPGDGDRALAEMKRAGALVE